MKNPTLNEIFKVQNCPLCGREPFVGACEDPDGSEATIRCNCGLDFYQLFENCLPDRAIEYAAKEWNRLAAKKEDEE